METVYTVEEIFQLVKKALEQFGKPSQWLSNNKGKNKSHRLQM
jgi:hypothetical protein